MSEKSQFFFEISPLHIKIFKSKFSILFFMGDFYRPQFSRLTDYFSKKILLKLTWNLKFGTWNFNSVKLCEIVKM